MAIEGGILQKIPIQKAASPVSVSWKWYNISQGVVEWAFYNGGSDKEGCLLFRNSYYFGNAFFPVYIENSEFRTTFAKSFLPLADNGVQNNSAPLAIIDFGKNRRIVAFIFVLSPGETWPILEGGFSLNSPPSGYATIPCSPELIGNFLVGYDPAQVEQWDRQTGTSLKGYSPNPKQFQGILEVSVSADFVQLFPGDSISQI
ncbi:MAG: hypothetical protein QW812_01100 [Thermoplasmataceae archaeon]